MIEEIIIGKITHVITIEFIITSFLRKLKVEIAAGFYKMNFMTETCFGFIAGQIIEPVTDGKFSAKIIRV